MATDNNPQLTKPSSSASYPDNGVTIDIPEDIIGIIKLSEDPDSISRYFIASPMFAGFGDLNSPKRLSFLQDLSRSSAKLRTYFTSAETMDILFAIGKDYDLDNSQISLVSTLVREVLTGDLFIKEFPGTISSELGIDDIKATNIANDITAKSFYPIVEDLKRIQRSKFPDKIMQLQKEARPEGLTAKPTVPETVKNMPLNQPTVKPVVPPPSMPEKQPETARPLVPPLAQISPTISVRPPAQPQQPKPAQPAPEALAQQPKPAEPRPTVPPPVKSQESTQRSPLPDILPPRPPAPPTSTVQQPKPSPVQRPQFRIPDIGQPVSKENGAKPGPTQDAQRSLEEALEKVASVIDLRDNKEK